MLTLLLFVAIGFASKCTEDQLTVTQTCVEVGIAMEATCTAASSQVSNLVEGAGCTWGAECPAQKIKEGQLPASKCRPTGFDCTDQQGDGHLVITNGGCVKMSSVATFSLLAAVILALTQM